MALMVKNLPAGVGEREVWWVTVHGATKNLTRLSTHTLKSKSTILLLQSTVTIDSKYFEL